MVTPLFFNGAKKKRSSYSIFRTRRRLFFLPDAKYSMFSSDILDFPFFCCETCKYLDIRR
jgi:hypothetical protein